MGNNLCRERVARAENSKNPIDRIIGRCAQVNRFVYRLVQDSQSIHFHFNAYFVHRFAQQTKSNRITGRNMCKLKFFE